MPQNILPILILNGRPASGKSEVIAYLNALSDAERRRRYNLGKLYELDDFPMLWTWFEEDALLEKVFNQPRIHTDKDGYFIHDDLWHLLIERISLDYEKLVRDNPTLHEEHTVLIEFSRGSEHGGYRDAYKHLSDIILEQAGILYIDVPYEESLRKNRRRFNPDRPDSILEHGLPDEKLERLYKEVDWHELIAENPDAMQIRDFQVSYATFDNTTDLTTEIGSEFENQMTECLNILLARLNK